MTGLTEYTDFFPDSISKALMLMDAEIANRVCELRLHRGGFLVLIIRNTAYFADYNGDLYDYPGTHCIQLSDAEFDQTFMELCAYSVHSVNEELKNGYFCLKNGARIGVAARAVYDEGRITSVKEITSLNIRIPREVNGCAKSVLDFLYVRAFPSIIVAGKPNSGKTTLLRDLARGLSGGFNHRYYKVAVVDERMELGGTSGKGLDLGINTDVLSGFSKAKGIELAARTLSPEMIICDEISTPAEAASVMYGFSSGIRFALSVHAGSREELRKKLIVQSLLSTGEFSYIVLLDGYSYKPEIIEATEVLYEAGGNRSFDAFNNGNRYSVV